MVQYLTVERRDLDGFDGLQQAVKGTHFDIVQLGRGKLNGSISHLGIGDLTLSVCSFDAGVCAQRTFHDDKILIGMLLDASDRVTQWSFDTVARRHRRDTSSFRASRRALRRGGLCCHSAGPE